MRSLFHETRLKDCYNKIEIGKSQYLIIFSNQNF